MSKVVSTIFHLAAKTTPAAIRNNDPAYKATVGKQEAKIQAAKDAAANLGKPGVPGATVAVRAQDLGAREDQLKAQAAAAGAVRINNDYDLLGVGSPRAKKRGSAATALGTN